MRSVAVAVTGLFVALVPSAAAAASADGSQEITHYAESVVLDSDGTAHVALDLTLDFADVPGHGPYLTVPVREATDDDRIRVYAVSDVTASSPSGAPADVDVQDTGDSVEVRIGDPDVGDVDGVQKYHVEYTVSDLINTDATTGDGDQLYWDPIGPDWELPLSDVSVTVTGPGAAQRVRCFAGETGSTAACSSAAIIKPGATFTQDSLAPGEQLTIVAGWPAGTFPGAHAVFEGSVETDSGSDDGSGAVPDDGVPGDFTLDENGVPVFDDGTSDSGSWDGGMSDGFDNAFSVVAVLVVLGIVGVIVAVIVGTARSGSSAPPADVMSLAARGYLRMDPVAPSGSRRRANWQMVPLRPADDSMSARERAWYQSMFFAGMVPVFWSDVRAPMHHSSSHSSHHTSSFSSGFGAGGGGGFGGDAGAGGGAGGGGGGSW